MKIKSIIFKLLIISILGVFTNNAYAQTPKLPSAEDFGSLGTRGIDISDDGKSIIFITGEDKEANVRLISLEDFSITIMPIDESNFVRDVRWVNDDYFIIERDNTIVSTANSWYLGNVLIFSKSKKTGVPILPERDFIYLNVLYGNLPNPDEILVETYTENLGTKIDLPSSERTTFDKAASTIFKVNAKTGRGKPIEYGSPETIRWGFSKAGVPIVRIDYSRFYNRNRIFVKDGKEWKQIYEYIPKNDEDDFNWNALLDENNGLFLLDENGVNTAYKIDLKTGKTEKFLNEPEKSIDYIGVEESTNKAVLISYSGLFPDYKWLDKEFEIVQAKLDGKYPDEYVNLIDWSDDKKKYLFSLKSSSTPEAFYLYDVEKNKISSASIMQENFQYYKFPRKEFEAFIARDKQEIPIFVTFPNKAKLEKLPTIVLPHGGPQAHDDIYYDYLSQFLASRGYLVLQPQFRGSTGFGYKYAEAGKRQWGGIMQNDVTDSLKWAIEKGWADKDRACIIGASYGGYAALAGVTMTPDLYKCAVSGAGVSDLNLMLKSEIKSNGKNSRATDYWKEHIGFDKYTTEEIAKISPINLVDKIKVPVLLIHGDDDTVVLPEQSKKMEAAMKKAGKDVKYVVLKNEDHWLSRRETRTQFLTEIENFLKPILKPEE